MKISLLFLSLVLIFAGWGCNKKTITDLNESTLAVQDETIVAIMESGGIDYSDAVINQEDESLIINLEYPIFDDGGNLSPYINNQIKTYIDGLKEEFVNDYNNVDHDYDLGPWFLEITYFVSRNDDAFISLVLEGGIYTGGAHPNYFYKTFLFNLEEGGNIMNITDVFNPAAMIADNDSNAYIDWLNYISTKARLQLMQKEYADADWINEGAGPSFQNFENFYFTDKEMIVVFSAYQVAPYAAGPQEVVFTIDELAEYLRAYNF